MPAVKEAVHTEISEANATGPVTWVLDDNELDWLTEAILGASDVIVDLETTGLDEYAWEGGPKNGGVGARISLASFTLPQGKKDAFGQWVWDNETPVTWILPLSHPDSPFRGKWRSVLVRVLTPAIRAKRPFSNQNIKFDSRWLYATCDIDISDLIAWDTKDGFHLLDETRTTKLKPRVAEDFDIPQWNEFDLTSPGASERVPLLDLGAYAARDTWWTWEAKQYQRERMWLENVEEEPFDREDRIAAGIGKLATWIAMPTVASLTKVEQRGMKLDIDWTREMLVQDLGKGRQALAELADHYELPVESASLAANAKWFLELTHRAVEKSELEITAYTKTNKPQWSRAVLMRQERKGSETASKILLARRSLKRAEFLTSWLHKVGPDGVIHASFNSGSVSTGRLSSSDPNLQQVTKKLRPAFIPRDGFFMADFDYSQIELRVAAFVSRSIPMIRAFQRGDDLHRLMGARIVMERNISENKRKRLELHLLADALFEEMLPESVDPADVTPEERQQAKAANFGLLYEMGAYGFQQYAETAYGVILTLEEATIIHHAFFQMWPGIKDWHEKAKADAHRHGYVVSPLGRVRRLHNRIWDGNDKMVSFAERQAINSPVQSMASDLLQMAMASMQGLLPAVAELPRIDGVFPVATVHDSIVAEIEQDNWEAIANQVADRMAGLDRVLSKFGLDIDVPLVADFGVGTRWSLTDISDPEEAPVDWRTEAAIDEEEIADVA
jgi:DNA polymerase I-like protein with 3'-5' exonuclease and polymerase domains